MHTHRSFSFQLQKSFLISTFFPFILVASFIAAIYSFMYHRDIQTLLTLPPTPWSATSVLI